VLKRKNPRGSVTIGAGSEDQSGKSGMMHPSVFKYLGVQPIKVYPLGFLTRALEPVSCLS